MRKYSIAIVGIAASAIAQAASHHTDISIDREKVDSDLVEALLSQSGLSEKEPSMAISSAVVDLAKHLTYDGQPAIDVESALLLAQQDSHDINWVHGGPASAGNCYHNCHNACHGSRSWR